MTTKVYITFGQIHVHKVGKHTLDKDCVAVIKADSYTEGRELAMKWFDGVFHNSYSQEEWDNKWKEILDYFPRGLIEIN